MCVCWELTYNRTVRLNGLVTVGQRTGLYKHGQWSGKKFELRKRVRLDKAVHSTLQRSAPHDGSHIISVYCFWHLLLCPQMVLCLFMCLIVSALSPFHTSEAKQRKAAVYLR